MTLDDSKLLSLKEYKNMLDVVSNLPDQIEKMLKLSKGIKIKPFKPEKIVVLGVGGSAIGGDLVKDWLSAELSIPVIVVREFALPKFVDKESLVFAVSYSGNTEETLSMFESAVQKKCKTIGISSGGKLEALCHKNKIPLIKIPSSYLPRTVLGYLLFSMIVTLTKAGICNYKKEINETLRILKESRAEFAASQETSKNLAKRIAVRLQNFIPVIYGHTIYEGVAHRWQSEFGENAKSLAFAGSFPEMMHNEIVGWTEDSKAKNFSIIFFRDKFEGSRLRTKLERTKALLLNKGLNFIEIWARGNSKLARMLYLLYLGDLVSVYLAILQGTDPLRTEAIDFLKSK